MSHFHDNDRPFLMRAFQMAEAAVRPPQKLGLRPEPSWAALVADQSGEIVSAVFSHGDAEDAVKKLFSAFQAAKHPGATLYLTLEPIAVFNRLPPVTESVRRLGVKRVVIGTLDPAQRYRGEGSRTLEQAGFAVVLADGEVARCCQNLLDDYSKWLQKGLAVLRAQVEITSGPDGSLDLQFARGPGAMRTDAVICRAGGPRQAGDAWRVVLDPDGWERPADRTILYQTAPSVPGPGVRLLPLRDGVPDLGAILRDLGSRGFLSVGLSGEPELFRLALRAGLIDSVRAHFEQENDSGLALSRIGRMRISQGGDPLEIKLNAARVVGGHLEAHPELC